MCLHRKSLRLDMLRLSRDFERTMRDKTRRKILVAMSSIDLVISRLSVEQDPLLDRFPANRTLLHTISAHLTGSMTTKKDHVLQAIQTYWTHGL